MQTNSQMESLMPPSCSCLKTPSGCLLPTTKGSSTCSVSCFCPKGLCVYCAGLCFMLTLPCLSAPLFPGKETFEPCVDLLWCLTASSVEQCTLSHHTNLEPEAKARKRLHFMAATHNYSSLDSHSHNNSYNPGLFEKSALSLLYGVLD